MAPRQASRARAKVARFAVLAAGALVLRRWAREGPAYAVQGTWEGGPSTLKGLTAGDFNELLKGLEPNVKLPSVSYSREGLALSVEDGRLNADYNSKLDKDDTFNFRINDEQAWRASFSSDDVSLRVRGQGRDFDKLSWEASQSGEVDGVGDVKVEFNSDKEYNLTVARQQLAAIAGANVYGGFRATNAGVTGCLEALRKLPGQAAVSYSVENPVGVYNLADCKHLGLLTVPVAGGGVALKMESDAGSPSYHGSYALKLQGGLAELKASLKGEELGYNVSYSRALNDLLNEDADVHMGVDQEGVYGRLRARRELTEGLDADYEATGRVGRVDHGEQGDALEHDLAHTLKLSNKLGYAQLSHGKGQAPRLRVGYEFDA